MPEPEINLDALAHNLRLIRLTARDIQPPRRSVHNGQGLAAACGVRGKWLRALVDCGSLHTDVQGLALPRPDWRITDFSGNYAVLDLTGSAKVPVPGERIRFIPSYWAVARTCRMPHIPINLVHDGKPGQAVPGFRIAVPGPGTASLSEVS